MIIFHNTERLVVRLKLFLKVCGICLRHPPAENVKGVDIMVCAGGQLPHIKIGVIGIQLFVGSQDVPAVFFQNTADFRIR